MCSVNPDIEDGDTNNLMPTVEPLSDILLCRKCKILEPVVVLQSKFPYCKSCFTELVSHKFFGCLGKNKTMKPTDKVLILCSGSQSSSVLLNLVKIGLHERHKKILSEASVLFIEAGSFIPLSIDERINLIKQLKEMVSFFGFKSYYSPLFYSKENLKSMDDISWCTKEFMEQVSSSSLVESMKTSTAKEDLLIKMRSSVGVSVAKELGCNKIFTGDTNDHIAGNVLTNVALGRGDQLPLDIGFSDNRYEDVLILRPLRECSRKEIAFYRLLHGTPFVAYPKGGTMKGKDDSIQKLTEKFIAELQVSFPSTVCMVVGTGNKLSSKNTSQHCQYVCPLCKGNVKEYNEDELSAVSATQISHLISTLGPEGFNCSNLTSKPDKPDQGFNCETSSCNNDCNCLKKKASVTLDDIKKVFCYGCRLIIKDMKTLDTLPAEVIKEANINVKLNMMKNEINDFLL